MIKKIIECNKMNRYILISSYILSIAVTILVYFAGGTTKGYTNLMYIPIAIVSSILGKKIGIIHSIFSGLLIGPFMPLNTGLNIPQEPINWIVRLIIYILIAFIIGFFSDYNKENQEYIANLLTLDIVTGLKNIEAIKREHNINKDHKTIIALSVKEYEEILSFFGYDFANGAILKFSHKLKEILDKYNNVELYRYDGMEFIIIITHNSKDSNFDKIIDSLQSITNSTIKVDDIPIYIEIVMGISSISKDIDILEGLRQGLISLRQAIDKGSKVVIYDTSLDEHFKNIVNIASNFKVALNNGNIKTACQNIYYANDENLYGSELLCRWISEKDTSFNPGQFIPIIQKTELINDLSKHIINIAIDRLLNDSTKDKIVSINFSPKDFKDEIVDYLIMKIEKNKINPKQLLVEITEDILIKKKEAMPYLQKIRSYGISIAIDDFGSGYSSYQSLSELPINVIKIDRSIIDKVDKNPLSRSLVKSIVDFCKAHNMTIVAEGVETKEISDVCKELDIDLLQGYYYHKPTIIK